MQAPREGMMAVVRYRGAMIAPFDADEHGLFHLVDVEYADGLGVEADQVLWEVEPGADVLEPAALPKGGQTPPMDPRDQVLLCKYCHRPRTDVAPAWLAAQPAGAWHPVDGGGDLMYTARSLSGAGACPRCGATGRNIHLVKADVAGSIARRLDLAWERNE